MTSKTRIEKLEAVVIPKTIQNYTIISSPEIEGEKCISHNGVWMTPEEYKQQGGDYEHALAIKYV